MNSSQRSWPNGTAQEKQDCDFLLLLGSLTQARSSLNMLNKIPNNAIPIFFISDWILQVLKKSIKLWCLSCLGILRYFKLLNNEITGWCSYYSIAKSVTKCRFKNHFNKKLYFLYRKCGNYIFHNYTHILYINKGLKIIRWNMFEIIFGKS